MQNYYLVLFNNKLSAKYKILYHIPAKYIIIYKNFMDFNIIFKLS